MTRCLLLINRVILPNNQMLQSQIIVLILDGERNCYNNEYEQYAEELGRGLGREQCNLLTG